MAESTLHIDMKTAVASELVREGYEVIEEPPWPPNRFISWEAYRPDLMGLFDREGAEEYAFIECETHPRMPRLLSKNIWRIELQSRIDRQSRLRRILVVPRGKLGAVDPKLRRCCEIWIADKNDLMKIPMCPR